MEGGLGRFGTGKRTPRFVITGRTGEFPPPAVWKEDRVVLSL